MPDRSKSMVLTLAYGLPHDAAAKPYIEAYYGELDVVGCNYHSYCPLRVASERSRRIFDPDLTRNCVMSIIAAQIGNTYAVMLQHPWK